MYFEIDGVDIAPMIKYKGIKWNRNDIDSAKAGRALSGLMNRGRVCTKIKLDVSLVPLKQSQVEKLLRLVYPEYVLVHYLDPLFGERTVQFYSNNIPATVCVEDSDGNVLWDEISFPLVER